MLQLLSHRLRCVVATLVVFVFFGVDASGQSTYFEQVQDGFSIPRGETGTAIFAEVADFDLDGDNDVVFVSADGTVSPNPHAIGWMENLDGTMIGALYHRIYSYWSSAGLRDMIPTVVDFDEDGDMDILGAGRFIENLGGQTFFGGDNPCRPARWPDCNLYPELDLLGSDLITGRVQLSDLDHDGDRDVVVIRDDMDAIVWYEHLPTKGTVADLQVISNAPLKPTYVVARDIDGDGFDDVVVSARDDRTVSWFRNQMGDPAPLSPFGGRQIISTSQHRWVKVEAVDVDGDNDMDVVVAGSSAWKVAWYENLDGAGTFSDEHVISTSVNTPLDLIAADLDNDGDPDLIVRSQWETPIFWFENLDGQGTFSAPYELWDGGNRVWMIFAGDMDSDGDIDVGRWTTSMGELNWSWVENKLELVTDVEERPGLVANGLILDAHPNPTTDRVEIRVDYPGPGQVDISVTDLLGREVARFPGIHRPAARAGMAIDLSPYPRGIYFVRVDTGSQIKTLPVIRR